MTSINDYGDKLVQAGAGHGADIASQRVDELDALSIEHVRNMAHTGKLIAVLDVGSGRGAQAARLLAAGAALSIATDREDFSREFFALAEHVGGGRAKFLRADLTDSLFNRNLIQCAKGQSFDVVVFQRTIHYLPYSQARVALVRIAEVMTSKGRLYISASGLGSELGRGYAHREHSMETRFEILAEDMAHKHGILAPVCLYTCEELVELCESTGLQVLSVQESAFGNIKIVAEKP